MCSKVYAGIFVIVAVLLAVLANVLPPDKIDYIITLSKIFDIMLPVLAVGALIKYISIGGHGGGKCGCRCKTCAGCSNSKCACGCKSCAGCGDSAKANDTA